MAASNIAPLQFASCIFETLGVYSPEKMEAWRQLFKTGDLSYYGILAS